MIALFGSSGYVAIVLALFIGAAGVPLPLNVMLASAGTLARHGQMSMVPLCLCSVIAAVAGDCLVYAFGAVAVRRVQIPAWIPCTVRARRLCERFLSFKSLSLMLFLTRWCVTAPATLITLTAGTRRYPLLPFLLIDIAGEALFVLLFLIPGFVLGGSWLVAAASSVALAVGVAAVGSTILVRLIPRPATAPTSA